MSRIATISGVPSSRSDGAVTPLLLDGQIRSKKASPDAMGRSPTYSNANLGTLSFDDDCRCSTGDALGRFGAAGSATGLPTCDPARPVVTVPVGPARPRLKTLRRGICGFFTLSRLRRCALPVACRTT
jgi:hypothetical protein